jgi:hypothetical protein
MSIEEFDTLIEHALGYPKGLEVPWPWRFARQRRAINVLDAFSLRLTGGYQQALLLGLAKPKPICSQPNGNLCFGGPYCACACGSRYV